MAKTTQRQKVKEHLENIGNITPLEALDKYGSLRLGAIIHTLRHEDGMNIKTEPTGKSGYATYYLLGKFGEKKGEIPF